MALTRLGLNQAVNLATNTTGTLGVANGGTGLTSGTTDQFLKFTGTTTIASAADNAGKILQVTHRQRTGQSIVTSTSSFEATPTYGSITPSSSSNKVLVMITLPSSYHSTSNGGLIKVVRESSVVSTGGSIAGSALQEDQFNAYKGTNDIQTAKPAFTFLDEPNTTSAVHYQIFIKNRADGAFYLGQSGTPVHDVTLMEISA